MSVITIFRCDVIIEVIKYVVNVIIISDYFNDYTKWWQLQLDHIYSCLWDKNCNHDYSVVIVDYIQY